MYYLVRIHKNIGALELVTRLIHEHQVAVMPGTTFGITDSCTLRISYGALDYESAREGASRLASGLRAILA
jgi:aspartate/methionine/tyrosine aminotransferase